MSCRVGETDPNFCEYFSGFLSLIPDFAKYRAIGLVVGSAPVEQPL